MLLWAIVLIVAGTITGIFAPVLFVVAAAGFVLLILALVRGRQRAQAAAPPPNRLE